MKNSLENLPNFFGIICKYVKNKIKFQQKELKKKYKNGKNTFFKYVMEIIKDNKINVLIDAIKDETIFVYLLGIDDFLIEGERLKNELKLIL